MSRLRVVPGEAIGPYSLGQPLRAGEAAFEDARPLSGFRNAFDIPRSPGVRIWTNDAGFVTQVGVLQRGIADCAGVDVGDAASALRRLGDVRMDSADFMLLIQQVPGVLFEADDRHGSDIAPDGEDPLADLVITGIFVADIDVRSLGDR